MDISPPGVTKVAIGLGLLCIAYLAIEAVVSYRKLRQFHGPPLAAFSSIWLFWQSLNSRVAAAEYDAIETYGSPARIGPTLLVTDDPDLVRHMNAPGSKWRRSGWYEGAKLDPRTDSVFSTRDEGVHADLRNKEIGGYNGRDIDTLESDIAARITDLAELIRTKYNATQMDLADVARYFTLDVLSTVAFGRPFGFMTSNQDLWDYGKTNAAFMPVLELLVNHGIIRWLIGTPLMQMLAAPKVTDKTGVGPMLAFARQAVSERYGPDAKPKKDMLGHFVEKGLSKEQCESEAALQVIAGSDSTTTILRCTLYMLITNPVAYTKLRDEIDRALQDGDISYPVVTYAEAQKLPFLIACIWEGLRMNPPLFGLKTKLAPPEGETVNGTFFPGGTEVGICDAAMCRSKDVFGPDSHFFRPERWIEAGAEERRVYQKTVDSIFGTGRFQCLGRHIAMMELHKTFVELVRSFDWSIADPMKGVATKSNAVHIQQGMNVIARAR